MGVEFHLDVCPRFIGVLFNKLNVVYNLCWVFENKRPEKGSCLGRRLLTMEKLGFLKSILCKDEWFLMVESEHLICITRFWNWTKVVGAIWHFLMIISGHFIWIWKYQFESNPRIIHVGLTDKTLFFHLHKW